TQYFSLRGPGTLEISTFTIGGSASGRLACPDIRASAVMMMGAPNQEMSRGITSLVSLSSALDSFDDACTARSRSIGSATSVASLHSMVVTWLLISVLPGSRSDTGTAVIRDSGGSASRLLRYRRSAPAESPMTTSLSLAPSALPISFVSVSEIVQVPNERWLDTVVLNIVLGARVGSSGRFPM